MLKDYDWNKLRDANCRSKVYYSDCQVVSAVNAYYMLTGEVAYKTERAYRSLCQLARAVHGSAICIRKVHAKLGIKRGKPLWNPLDRARFDCPIECSVSHNRYGFHSVLLVDRVKRCDTVRMTNFQWETRQGWMFYRDLQQYLESHKGGGDYDTRMHRCFPMSLVEA